MRRLRPFGMIALGSLAGCGPSDLQVETDETVGTSEQALVGVPEDGYPNYQERLMLVAINRARSDPNVVGQTASSCSNSRTIRPPLMYAKNGSRAARFHCANCYLNDGGLSHTSYCTLRSDIGTTFESTCDGSASCACQAGTSNFNCTTGGGTGTGVSTRVGYFGYSTSSEVGAVGYGTGWDAVYGWMSECPPNTGHRDILTSTYNQIGLGYYGGSTRCWNRYYFGNPAAGGAATYTLPAGIHRPETGTNFDFYVNYYDTGGAPQSVNVVVDGVCQAMSVEIGSGGNATYKTSRSVTNACHQYWFLVRDSSGARWTYPEVGAWGVGNCTGYVANATASDCEVCTNGQTQPCGNGQCAGTQTCTGGTWGPCNGGSPSVETCDGIDNDCDGNLPANEADGDNDTYMVCEGDCNDSNASVHPGATEQCNGVDDDCAGGVPANEADADNDTYMVCEGDCDDGNASVHPGATEQCNGVDDDCANGVPANESDNDGDTYAGCEGDCNDGNANVHPGATEQCNGLDDDCANGVPANEADADNDTYMVCEGDCNDGNANVHPGATEQCNGLDDDCANGVPANESDSDGDTYMGCEGDCDDGDANVHPGATEQCNGDDDDCDLSIDEGCPCSAGQTQPCGTDTGACVAGTQSCVNGSWGECVGAVGPSPESCNGEDDDCDGEVPPNEVDGDGDGYRICDGDCDDGNDAIHPDAEEDCNGIDDDCDGPADEDCGCNEGESRDCGTNEGECQIGIQQCEGGTWGDCVGGIEPVPEVCGDGLDNDCDGVVDTDCGQGGSGAGASGPGGAGPGDEATEQGVLTGSCGCRLVGPQTPRSPSGGGLLAIVGISAAGAVRRRRSRSRISS